MEHIRVASLSSYQQTKRRVIIAAAIFCAVIAPFMVLVEEGTVKSRVLDLASIIGFGILILSWCYYDSLERDKRLGAGFRVLVVILGVLALFIYLIKSRGLIQGVRSIGAALLVCIGMALILFLSAGATAVVFGVE